MVSPTVDGKNPTNQLRLVVYPIIYKGFVHPRWLAGFLPSTVLFRMLWEPFHSSKALLIQTQGKLKKKTVGWLLTASRKC